MRCRVHKCCYSGQRPVTSLIGYAFRPLISLLYLVMSFFTRTSLLLILGFLPVLTACSSFLPQPDCGAIQNLRIWGVVLDGNNQPIEDATVIVESLRLNKCLNSVPISDIKLTSDEMGAFDTTVPIISQDDLLRFEVDADGYSNYVYDQITYTYFRDKLIVILPQVQSTPLLATLPF